jgi:hypothetical protein
VCQGSRPHPLESRNAPLEDVPALRGLRFFPLEFPLSQIVVNGVVDERLDVVLLRSRTRCADHRLEMTMRASGACESS